MSSSHLSSLGLVISNVSDRDSIDGILRAGVVDSLQGQSEAYMEEKEDEDILRNFNTRIHHVVLPKNEVKNPTNTMRFVAYVLANLSMKRQLEKLGVNMNITHAASENGCYGKKTVQYVELQFPLSHQQRRYKCITIRDLFYFQFCYISKFSFSKFARTRLFCFCLLGLPHVCWTW